MQGCIRRKRDGGELEAEEWNGIVGALMDGRIDEAQMAALCMACVWRGMSIEESFALTRAMVRSGETIAFDPSGATIVDKHSSGGVSDIVSLSAVPLAAACGAHVAKLSGRALGHTGGTIDKLESIPGFDVELTPRAFVEQVRRVGCAIAAQSRTLVPADKRIYALRDRTGTVPCVGLIASSIVSKKIAGGAHAFVFDVKTGAASFVPHPAQARELARSLVAIAQRFERRAIAYVTDMSQPLGRCIGNGIEAIEARDFLRGDGDPRANEVVLEISAALVAECGIDEAHARVGRALASGAGYEKFLEMIAAQHGDPAAFAAMRPGDAIELHAPASGYVREIDVVALGRAARELCEHDRLGGLRVNARIGDFVERGQPLLHAYGARRELARDLCATFTLSEEIVEAPPLFYELSP